MSGSSQKRPRLGFVIHESRIAIRQETKEICSALRVDPLRLMSSGCLLIVADRRKSSGILRSLRQRGIPARIIGTVTPRSRGRKLVGVGGAVREVAPSERDELYRVIESYRAG